MSTSAAAVTPERIMQFTWVLFRPWYSRPQSNTASSTYSTPVPRPCRRPQRPLAPPSAACETIMNVLVGLNFLAKDGDRYALTPESATFLVSTKPSFQGGVLRMQAASSFQSGCS